MPHVICSCFEHNSVLRPLKYLNEKELIDLTIISPQPIDNKSQTITRKNVEKSIQQNTVLVCITHISNVTGNENDIKSIGELCKENKILFFVDCAQSVGHKIIDMQKFNIDYLAFSGHKGFLTPQGIGALVINNKIKPFPLIYGGTGTESEKLIQPLSLPEGLESGTLMTPNIISLNAGIKYVNKYFNKINEKIMYLSKYFLNLIKPLISQNKITIYSSNNCENGVICFNLKKYDSIFTTEYLNSKNIYVRGGLHCAPLTHTYLNTLNTGAVRISLSFKNTKFELKKVAKVLINLANK